MYIPPVQNDSTHSVKVAGWVEKLRTNGVYSFGRDFISLSKKDTNDVYHIRRS